MSGKYKQYVGASIGFVLLALFFMQMEGYFNERISPGRENPESISVKGMETSVVTEEKIDEFETAVGTITSNKETTVSARIPAHIKAIHVKPGMKVESGQLLMELDTSDIETKLAQARSNRSAAIAAHEQAQTSFSRYKNLYETGSATKAEFENADTQLKTTAAKKNEIDNAINELEVMMGYAEIKAPYQGTIVDKKVDLGDLASPGMPLIKMQDIQGLRLEVSIPESQKEAVYLGQSLGVKVDHLEKSITGVCDEIVPVADPTTRSYLIRIALEPVSGLAPGMFGRCYLPIASRERIFVDARAVYRVGQLEMVRVVTGDTAETRLIRVGYLQNGKYEVISGLKPGEIVLLSKEQGA